MEHKNISKSEALELMRQGRRITHCFYTDEEYLIMRNGKIYDERGYCVGDEHSRFWKVYNKWKSGWSTCDNQIN